MHEADLRQHLAAQTSLRIGLIDLPMLRAGGAEAGLSARLADGDAAILFDGIEAGDLAETGRLLWLLMGVLLGGVGVGMFLQPPREAQAANDRFEDYILCTGAVAVSPRQPTDSSLAEGWVR